MKTKENPENTKAIEFTRKKAVVLPIQKIEVGVSLFVHVTSEFYKGKAIEKNPDGTDKEPVDLINVNNLETGEEGSIVCGKVLHGILVDNYPIMVGRRFEIVKLPKKGSGATGYHPYTVYEIE